MFEFIVGTMVIAYIITQWDEKRRAARAADKKLLEEWAKKSIPPIAALAFLLLWAAPAQACEPFCPTGYAGNGVQYLQPWQQQAWQQPHYQQRAPIKVKKPRKR
jgi:hypothetical protein